MSRVRFQLDVHVSNAVARALRQHGVDVRTATDAGLLHTPDAVVLARAYAEGRVVVTHNADFLRLNDDQQPPAGITYCAQRARSIGELVEALLLIYEVIDSDGIAGQVEYH
ncbi:MAG: DUF5615 family PIN-like protein [Thermomicrobiales bacterium]